MACASRTQREQYLALRFAFAPLLVWVASQGVFELLAFDLGAVAGRLADAVQARAGALASRPAAETAARILWAASLLLFVLVAAALLGYAIWLMRTRLSGRARQVYAALALALCVLSLAHAAIGAGQRSAFSMIYFFTHDALVACACYAVSELRSVDAAVMVLNVLAAVVPPAALVAGCGALALPSAADAEALAGLERAMARLRTVLAAGSALLVTGIVHQVAWQRWPLALLDEPAGLPDLVSALALYWGVVYSLLIVAFYAPAAWVLHRHARRLLEQQPALAGAHTPDAWLDRHGLSRGALHRLPQVAAMLAPALAGPLGTVVSGLGETVFLN